MSQVLGIDVSSYQGNIDWLAVKGVSFVFIKASEGSTFTDPRFALNWACSKVVGIPRGAYHYYRNGVDPLAQVKKFIDVLGSDKGELPPVVDVEDETFIADYDSLMTFCVSLSVRLGVTPSIYTRSSYWDGPQFWTHPFKWTLKNDLWVADYGKVDVPHLPSDWTDWKFWQYGQGNGKDYGCQSPTVDLNVFNGSPDDFTNYLRTK